MQNNMAPFGRITEESVIHTLEVVGGIGFLILGLSFLYLGLDGHPDPRLFGQSSYIIQGIGWIISGLCFWAGLRFTRKQRALGD